MSHAGRRGGRDGDSTARPRCAKVESCGGRKGEEREEALGLLIARRTQMDGMVSGLGLSHCHPEPQLSP